MHSFNEFTLVTSYIKQLLSSYNLPKLDAVDVGSYVIKDVRYIYKKSIVKASNSGVFTGTGDIKLVPVSHYFPGKRIINVTDTYKQDCLEYDYKVHEYLGKYLRFMRDYFKLDLMSMYNCFSNRSVPVLFTERGGEVSLSSGTSDKYKVYAVPVKFGKVYTIGIESATPIEFRCGYFENRLIEKEDFGHDSSSTDILQSTYQRRGTSSLHRPFVYTRLANLLSNSDVNDSNKSFYHSHEKNLKLFIKVPIELDAPIVVLEGDYSNTMSPVAASISEFKSAASSYSFTEDGKFKYPNFYNLQLLHLPQSESAPFADRLVEFLTGNVITHLDEIPENIKRVQQLLEKVVRNYNAAGHYGEWDPYMLRALQTFACDRNLYVDNFDITGYVDKDLEAELKIAGGIM